jgi:hypothetical protein
MLMQKQKKGNWNVFSTSEDETCVRTWPYFLHFVHINKQTN